MKNADWLWPNNKRIAWCFNVCLEQLVGRQGARHQSDGQPAAGRVLDTMAISWAAYGVKDRHLPAAEPSSGTRPRPA